jgi:hypothetical protein
MLKAKPRPAIRALNSKSIGNAELEQGESLVTLR